MEMVLSLQMMETGLDMLTGADSSTSSSSCNSNTCSSQSTGGCTVTQTLF